jgi:GDPmannose 4,6-dehydratase
VNHSDIKFFNAASTDSFGNQPDTRLSEKSLHRPVSPYGIAKSATFWATKNYREAFGVRAANGILTNHESPLRDASFFSQRAITGLKKVSQGLQKTVALGNLNTGRDWLWAGEVAEAIHHIGSATKRDDYVVGSGITSTLRAFVATACEMLGLNIDEVVEYDQSLARPLDIETVMLDPTKTLSSLGWAYTLNLEEIVDRLLAGSLD